MLTRRKQRRGCLPRVILIGILAGVLFVAYDQLQLIDPADDPVVPTVTSVPTETPATELTVTPMPTLTPLPLIGEPTTDPSQ